MKKKLTNIALILMSAFAFTSCGDSKEAVVDDAIDLMEKTVEAAKSGDTDKVAKLKENAEELEKRAKALGIDFKDPSTMPDDLKKKFEDAAKDMMKEQMAEVQKGLNDAMKDASKNIKDAVK